MIKNTEQLAQVQKNLFDTFQVATMKSFEGFEKLAELNLQALRASIEESSEQVRTMMSVQDPKAFADLASTAAQPSTEKFAAYARHVLEITNATSAELAKLTEKQVADGNKQVHAAIDAIAKTAPAGSEGVITLVRTAVTAANTAVDQFSKATKQAVELAESNIEAATKTAAPRGKKAA